MPPKNIKAIEQFIQQIFHCLGKWQVRNVAGVVYGLLHSSSPLISEIARSFPYTRNYKPARKRIERFLRNRKCFSGLCHVQYIKWIISIIPKKKKQSIIIDYTFLGRYMILWAAIPFKRRCIPIYFKIIRNPHVTKMKQRGRMIYLETDFLRFLRLHLPRDRRWVIIGDRGFGNSRNIKLCQSVGFDFIFRVKGDIRVMAKRGNKYKDRKIKHLSKAKWRQGVIFKGLSVNLLSLTESTDDPWYLITNLKNPNTVKKLYKERFWIEEMFRDMKTHEQLKKTLIRSLNAMKRLAFCLQLSFSIVFFIGILAKKSAIVKKKLIGLSKSSFVHTALLVLRHLSQKFTVFLKKVIKHLRLGKGLFDTS